VNGASISRLRESPSQIMRNMKSIGIDLQPHVKKGLLMFHASRPTATGLESHLAETAKIVADFKPSVMVVDPISNMISVGNVNEVKSMLTRLVDYLKSDHITTMFTSLTSGGDSLEQTEVGMSSLMDTWIVLRDVERGGERNRELHVLKSRGMEHSNQLREFVMTKHGIELVDVYTGPSGVLTGTARVAKRQGKRPTRWRDSRRSNAKDAKWNAGAKLCKRKLRCCEPMWKSPRKS